MRPELSQKGTRKAVRTDKVDEWGERWTLWEVLLQARATGGRRGRGSKGSGRATERSAVKSVGGEEINAVTESARCDAGEVGGVDGDTTWRAMGNTRHSTCEHSTHISAHQP